MCVDAQELVFVDVFVDDCVVCVCVGMDVYVRCAWARVCERVQRVYGHV